MDDVFYPPSLPTPPGGKSCIWKYNPGLSGTISVPAQKYPFHIPKCVHPPKLFLTKRYFFLLFQNVFQVLSMAWLGGFSRDPILLPFRLTLLTSVLRKGKEFGQQNCRGQNISKSRKNAQNNKKQQQQNII